MSNNNVWLSGSLTLADESHPFPPISEDWEQNIILAWMHTERSIFAGQHPVIFDNEAARIFRQEQYLLKQNRWLSLTGSLSSYRNAAFVVGKRISFHPSSVARPINQVWLQGLLQIQNMQSILLNRKPVDIIRGWMYTGKKALGYCHPVIFTAKKPKYAILKAGIQPNEKLLTEVLVQGHLMTLGNVSVVNVKRVDFLGCREGKREGSV